MVCAFDTDSGEFNIITKRDRVNKACRDRYCPRRPARSRDIRHFQEFLCRGLCVRLTRIRERQGIDLESSLCICPFNDEGLRPQPYPIKPLNCWE